MSKEEKKAIELLKEVMDVRSCTISDDIGDEEIRIILNLIEKQEKVIEKLVRAIIFMGTNPDITEEEVIKAFTENPTTEELLDKFRKDYISKDKIREKIKQWKNEDEEMWDAVMYAEDVYFRIEKLLEE